jgi:RNA polymerase sigma factor (sigma-70 family)
MNIKIHTRNLDLLKTHQKLIDRHCAKIRKMLPTFAPDTVDLDVNLEKLPRGSQYQTGVVLALPQRVIRVEEIEDNPTASLVLAFTELRRRVKRFKSQLNRERLWRKAELEAPASTPSPAARQLEGEAGEHIEKIENYVRREIYHQVLMGVLPPGLIEPQSIVDDVYVRVTSLPEARPAGLTTEQWMFQVARNLLRGRMREIEERRDESHMEEPARPERQWDDEDLNFHQPDESLRLEDLLKDASAYNPEELLSQDESEDRLQLAVAALPPSVRESLVLFALEGFTSDEVAMMTSKKSAQVLDDVEEAREILRREFKP